MEREATRETHALMTPSFPIALNITIMHWGISASPGTEQQSEHLIRGGRYASCVHAGGLSCTIMNECSFYVIECVSWSQDIISVHPMKSVYVGRVFEDGVVTVVAIIGRAQHGTNSSRNSKTIQLEKVNSVI